MKSSWNRTWKFLLKYLHEINKPIYHKNYFRVKAKLTEKETLKFSWVQDSVQIIAIILCIIEIKSFFAIEPFYALQDNCKTLILID